MKLTDGGHDNMITVKDIIFRVYDDSIVALKNSVLIRRYGGNPDTDYCIAYGFIDDERGSSFYVLGTADQDQFIFHRADIPVIAGYQTVKDDPVLFHFPCSDKLLRELYAEADAFMAKRKTKKGRKGWRRYGWLDQYRLKSHPDVIRAELKGYTGMALMKLFAEDEDRFYGRIVKYEGSDGEILPGTEAVADKNKEKLIIRI